MDKGPNDLDAENYRLVLGLAMADARRRFYRVWCTACSSFNEINEIYDSNCHECGAKLPPAEPFTPIKFIAPF